MNQLFFAGFSPIVGFVPYSYGLHLLKNVCMCPSAGLSLHLQWWTNPTPGRRHRSYCSPLYHQLKIRGEKKFGVPCEEVTFVDISAMRLLCVQIFAYNFTQQLSKKIYVLSPRFVKIYLKMMLMQLWMVNGKS